MRSLIIGFVIFLAACNQGTTQVPYSDPALVAKVDALTKALAAATREQAQKFSSLQIIGKVGTVNAAGINLFGPCENMGDYQGQGGTDSSNPLASQFEIYKQIANPQTGCPGSVTSYNEITGLHDRLKFAAWDGPNCTGNLYVETDIPQNAMSFTALQSILVMLSPDPTDDTVYASQENATPESIQIQSAFALNNSCGPDIETRMVIPMFKNDVQVTGVPDSLVPGSWSRVAP